MRQVSKHTPSGNRYGITLIEIMVVTAVSSVVLGVVISVLMALMQKDREVREFAVQSERQGELAEALRVDIRQATELSLAAQTVLVIAGRDERKVRYEITAGGCRRLVDIPNAAKPLVDFFLIGPAVSWALETGPGGRRRLYIVSLQRTAPATNTSADRMPFLVYAALGADLL